MPSSKRAKLSHPTSPEQSRTSSGEGLPARYEGGRDAESDNEDERADPEEVEEEEEIVEEYEEEEQEVEEEELRDENDSSVGVEEVEDVGHEGDAGYGGGVGGGGGDDGEEEVEEVEERDTGDGGGGGAGGDGEEEVEEVEEVEEEDEDDNEEEEVEEIVEEEEVEEDESGGGGEVRGEEDNEEYGDGSEKSEEAGVSEAEYMEEYAESAEIDAPNLRQAQSNATEADQDTHNTAGDVDDAEEEDEGVSVKRKNHCLHEAVHDNSDDSDGGDEDMYVDDDDDDDEDDDDNKVTRKELGCEVDDEEDDRRKQLAVLMCFSSFQTLMAMELCRDTTPTFDEISREDSTMLPAAFLKLVLLAVSSLMKEEGQQSWKVQRPGQEWAHIERGVGSVDATTRDTIWRRKYSMSYSCFLYLAEELRPFIQSESQIHVIAPLETERAVAMVLYRLAHGLSAREVAEKYNVEASIVGKYTLIVASALSEANKLYGRYLAIPTGERISRIISQFRQLTNVSQMCGAIDGTHIKLHIKPDKWGRSPTYQNPPKSPSILLQAVCDANRLFWDVCCMAPGGAHEAAQFVSSNLYQKVKDGLSLKDPVLTLGNREVTPFMVSGSAYPLRPFLINMFDTDDALRRAFDEQLRKGLECIQGAFAILKARWRILKCMNVNLMHAPRIAVACCVLHNICQLWGEPEPPLEQIEPHVNEHSQGLAAAYEVDEASRIAGEAVREALFRDWVKRSLDNPYVSNDQEH